MQEHGKHSLVILGADVGRNRVKGGEQDGHASPNQSKYTAEHEDVGVLPDLHGEGAEEEGRRGEGDGLAGVGQEDDWLATDLVGEDAVRIGDEKVC